MAAGGSWPDSPGILLHQTIKGDDIGFTNTSLPKQTYEQHSFEI